MAGRIEWDHLVSEVSSHPIQGILIDRSTTPVSIRILCRNRSAWIEDLSLTHVRRLQEQGMLPGHMVNYLTQTGLISL